LKLLILLLTLLPSLGISQGEDHEELADQMNEDRRRQMEKAITLHETSEKIKENSLTSLKELSLLDDRAIEGMQKVIEDSQISAQHRDVVKGIIIGKAKGKPLEKVFEYFPVLLEISVDVVRSKEAMSSLLNIFRRKEDLKLYGYVWLGIVILSFFIKRYLFPKSMGFFKALFIRGTFNILLMAGSFLIFYSIFEHELDPLLRIIGHHL
jgi:hypothetical protein